MSKLLLFLLFTVPPIVAQTQESTATLPLSEVLKLYEQHRTAKQGTDGPAPLDASLDSIHLSGQPRAGALEVTGVFHLTVLKKDGWTRLPLLNKTARLKMSALPKVEHGVVALDGEQLVFISQRPGAYQFQIQFLLEAQQTKDVFQSQFTVHHATVAVFDLASDNNLFTPVGAHFMEDQTAVFYPVENRFDIAWKQTRKLPETVMAETRPAIDAVVPMGYGNIVSTREGARIARYRFELRFEGVRDLEVQLPPGVTLRRVYVNDHARDIKAEDDRLQLQIAPKRVGDTSGSLELVLVHPREIYDLSGRLTIQPPRISWPVNEFWLNLHLPEVFNYTLAAGSMSKAEAFAEPTYIYDAPTPGKSMQFHQYLIDQTAPHLALDYTIDLTGHYYR